MDIYPVQNNASAGFFIQDNKQQRAEDFFDPMNRKIIRSIQNKL